METLNYQAGNDMSEIDDIKLDFVTEQEIAINVDERNWIMCDCGHDCCPCDRECK